MATMDNKKRNELVLNLACEMLQNINYEIDNAYVEDVEGEEGDVETKAGAVGATLSWV